ASVALRIIVTSLQLVHDLPGGIAGKWLPGPAPDRRSGGGRRAPQEHWPPPDAPDRAARERPPSCGCVPTSRVRAAAANPANDAIQRRIARIRQMTEPSRATPTRGWRVGRSWGRGCRAAGAGGEAPESRIGWAGREVERDRPGMGGRRTSPADGLASGPPAGNLGPPPQGRDRRGPHGPDRRNAPTTR